MLQPMWQMQLLGDVRVYGPGGRVITKFLTSKHALLLAYLTYKPGAVHARDVLIDLLWPGSRPDAGKSNLRAVLTSLRKQLEPADLGVAVIDADRLVARVIPGAIGSDAALFDAELAAAAGAGSAAERMACLERAAAAYQGELMPWHYHDWVIRERERLADRYVKALAQLADLKHKAGAIGDAIHWAKRAVEVDPSIEDLQCRLIRLYRQAGRNADAARQGAAMRHAVEGELEVPLGKAALELLEQLPPTPGRRPEPAAPRRVRARAKPALQPEPPAAASTANRLPAPSTSFIAREEEINALLALLEADLPRLITLTGGPGAGKTRLAQECGRRVAQLGARSVWWAPLAGVTDPGSVVEAVARAVSPKPPTGPDFVPGIASALGGGPSLLILDNAEHVIDACADLVGALLAECPSLTCMVTSRQRLALSGEQEIPVAPLEVPAWDAALDDLALCPSVRLFMDRARLVRPDFALAAGNAQDVADLCARLEGVPLAIELAAPLVRSLSARQILSGVTTSLGLPESGSRDVAPRHRSVRAAIQWSYDLLPPPPQRFLAAMSVFRGGWTGDAVGSLWTDAAAYPLLDSLVERSLITAHDVDGEMRYGLLEAVRDFAAGKVTDADAPVLATRHSNHFASLAEQAGAGMKSGDQAHWVRRLDAERDNLAAALEWATGAEPAAALRMAAALAQFWFVRGYLTEGRAGLRRALAASRATSADPELQARGLSAMAVLAAAQGDTGAALAGAREAVDLIRGLGDTEALAAAVNNLAVAATSAEEFQQAEAGFREALALFRRRGAVGHAATALGNLGSILLYQGRPQEARALLEESLRSKERLGQSRSVAVSLHNMAEAARVCGDPVEAQELLRTSLKVRWAVGERVEIPASLLLLAGVTLQLGAPERAATLLGAADAVRHAVGAEMLPADVSEDEKVRDLVRRALPSGAYLRRTADGRSMPPAECVGYALGSAILPSRRRAIAAVPPQPAAPTPTAEA